MWFVWFFQSTNTNCSMPDRHPFAMLATRLFSPCDGAGNILQHILGLEKKTTTLFAATISDCWFHLYTRCVVSKAVISALLIRRTPPKRGTFGPPSGSYLWRPDGYNEKGGLSIKSLNHLLCVFGRCLKHRWQEVVLALYKTSNPIQTEYSIT